MASLKGVRVIMENPRYNYVTDVNGAVPFEETRQYFVGQRFNMGSDENENFVKCVDVIDLTGYKCFNVTFNGRSTGALGVTYAITTTVWAESVEGVEAALYDHYQDISNIRDVVDLATLPKRGEA